MLFALVVWIISMFTDEAHGIYGQIISAYALSESTSGSDAVNAKTKVQVISTRYSSIVYLRGNCWSSARFSFNTLTRGSPSSPKLGLSVKLATI